MIEPWEKQQSELIGDYRVFRLRRDRSLSPQDGVEYPFYVIEAPDWINVVPVTPEGKVVLIRQYRHGTGSVSLEIPGGMLDDSDEDPRDAAIRELREETGYVAEAMIPIGYVTPNPALFDNRCFTYFARNARLAGAPDFDGTEYVEVELVELAEIPALIRSGRIDHALVIAAFFHFEQYQRAT